MIAACITQIVYFVSFHVTQLAHLDKLTESSLQRSQELLLFLADVTSHFDEIQVKSKDEGLRYNCFQVSCI